MAEPQLVTLETNIAPPNEIKTRNTEFWVQKALRSFARALKFKMKFMIALNTMMAKDMFNNPMAIGADGKPILAVKTGDMMTKFAQGRGGVQKVKDFDITISIFPPKQDKDKKDGNPYSLYLGRQLRKRTQKGEKSTESKHGFLRITRYSRYRESFKNGKPQPPRPWLGIQDRFRIAVIYENWLQPLWQKVTGLMCAHTMSQSFWNVEKNHLMKFIEWCDKNWKKSKTEFKRKLTQNKREAQKRAGKYVKKQPNKGSWRKGVGPLRPRLRVLTAFTRTTKTNGFGPKEI